MCPAVRDRREPVSGAGRVRGLQEKRSRRLSRASILERARKPRTEHPPGWAVGPVRHTDGADARRTRSQYLPESPQKTADMSAVERADSFGFGTARGAAVRKAEMPTG
ncbi:hypothetical protein GCM10023224_51220 [Streptomonospora halophila]|uniref:Uncharacterized protein n=1 Tax=Streptomonospora halophila TaxID=427369 RepID=A0ABP9H4E2_9ACTN